MTSKKIICLLLGVLLLASPAYSGKSLKEISEDKIKSSYPTKVSIEDKKVSIPKEVRKQAEKDSRQKFLTSKLRVWKIYDNAEKKSFKGWAILDNVKGKVKPITILLQLDSSGNVHRLDIVKYRESHGGAVQNKSWLQQFVGKINGMPLRVNHEIDGVSGATISARSVTKGVLRLQQIFQHLEKLWNSQ